MNNIAQLRDTINAAYRAVWYFRRSQDYYAIRWAHDALARTRGLIERFAPVPQVALDNAAHVVESALQAADIVLTADYLEAGLLPPLLELQAKEIALAGTPEPDRKRFERNLAALFRAEDGATIVREVFGDAFTESVQHTIAGTRRISDAEWEQVLHLTKVLQESGYHVEYTATGDITLKQNGYYLHTNNAPVIEGLSWGTRTRAAGHRVFGAGLLYHIRGLQELYPGLHMELYETNPAVLAYAILYAPMAELLADTHVQVALFDETEDAETLRGLFPEEPAQGEGTDLIVRTHAPSVSCLRDRALREYLLRFGDQMGLAAGSSPKKASVVIPCRNAESTIDECILSLVKQTVGIDQIEVICVDAGSTDGTGQKLLSWAERYPASFTLKSVPDGEDAAAFGASWATTQTVLTLNPESAFDEETVELAWQKNIFSDKT